MKLSIITLVNNPEIYSKNVLESTKDFEDYIEYVRIDNPEFASKGLNAGLDKASNDLVICCHQDVYFLNGWYDKLRNVLAKVQKLLQESGMSFGVCGMAGTTHSGRMMGNHSGLGSCNDNNDIVEVQTLDCSCLVLMKSSDLRFDEGLKYFHMYGEDIALQAKENNMCVYVINVYIDHRTMWTSGGGFIESQAYMRNKWRHKVGTIHTTVGAI